MERMEGGTERMESGMGGKESGMNRKKGYLIIQAILCVLLVFLLSQAAVRIFREGSKAVAENPLAYIYTPEAVAREFARLAPVLFVSIGMGLAGMILGIRDERAGKGVRDGETERNLIKARLFAPGSEVLKERSRQRKFKGAGWAAFGICMLPVLIYMTDQTHFPETDPEGMILSLAAGVFPWILAGIACLMAAGILEEQSLRREIAAAKGKLSEQKKLAVQQDSAAQKELAGNPPDGELHHSLAASAEGDVSAASKSVYATPAWKRYLPPVLIIVAALCILAGIMNGSMQDVLVKAAAICTECVGLG